MANTLRTLRSARCLYDGQRTQGIGLTQRSGTAVQCLRSFVSRYPARRAAVRRSRGHDDGHVLRNSIRKAARPRPPCAQTAAAAPIEARRQPTGAPSANKDAEQFRSEVVTQQVLISQRQEHRIVPLQVCEEYKTTWKAVWRVLVGRCCPGRVSTARGGM
jgi:hypothetical protein